MNHYSQAIAFVTVCGVFPLFFNLGHYIQYTTYVIQAKYFNKKQQSAYSLLYSIVTNVCSVYSCYLLSKFIPFC